MEKLYKVQMNSKGTPNFSTAVEVADRPQGWIPCSERLPSEKKAVLICVSGGIRFTGKLIRTDTGYKWSIPLFAVWMDVGDGDAWMPLPEPWKGADDENY